MITRWGLVWMMYHFWWYGSRKSEERKRGARLVLRDALRKRIKKGRRRFAEIIFLLRSWKIFDFSIVVLPTPYASLHWTILQDFGEGLGGERRKLWKLNSRVWYSLSPLIHREELVQSIRCQGIFAWCSELFRTGKIACDFRAATSLFCNGLCLTSFSLFSLFGTRKDTQTDWTVHTISRCEWVMEQLNSTPFDALLGNRDQRWCSVCLSDAARLEKFTYFFEERNLRSEDSCVTHV